jgi:hypothetical protein
MKLVYAWRRFWLCQGRFPWIESRQFQRLPVEGLPPCLLHRGHRGNCVGWETYPEPQPVPELKLALAA